MSRKLSSPFIKSDSLRFSRQRVSRLRKYRLLIILAVSVFVLDQLSKIWVERFSGLELGVYPPFGGVDIVPGFLAIVYSVNKGAAWGMFSGAGTLLALLGVAALVAIALMRRHLELHKTVMQLVFGLAAGGIAGNLVDRIRLGHVVDFIDVDLGFYRWPTFNVADSAMVCAVAMYIMMGIAEDLRARRSRH